MELPFSQTYQSPSKNTGFTRVSALTFSHSVFSFIEFLLLVIFYITSFPASVLPTLPLLYAGPQATMTLTFTACSRFELVHYPQVPSSNAQAENLIIRPVF